jgi:hypothetical protein
MDGTLAKSTYQERCRVCRAEAMFVAVLHDGAHVPYCRDHLPDWKALDQSAAMEGAYQQFLISLRQALKN